MIKATLLGLASVTTVVVVAVPLVMGRARPAEAALTAPPTTCSVPDTAAAANGSNPRPGSFANVTLSPSQMDTARKVVAVATSKRITRRGVSIALQAAMQESTLNAQARNGNAVGLFQQIAPGPYTAYVGYDRTDPAAATGGFFTVLLKRVPGYETDPRPNHDLAEEVERSGEGWRYQKWQTFADALTGVLVDGAGSASAVRCEDRSVKGRIAITVRGNDVILPPEAGVEGVVRTASAPIATAIAAGLSWLGTPYAWGGGNANGPTRGISDGGGAADQHGDTSKTGFDCSGLTLYSYAQAGITLTRPSRTQLTNAKHTVPWPHARAGDLLFWGTHHVALYLGLLGDRHLMLEAPQSGDVVKVSVVRVGKDFRNVAARPSPGDQQPPGDARRA